VIITVCPDRSYDVSIRR